MQLRGCQNFCNTFLLAHSKNELMQWRGVRRLSVCPSVNFCANRFFSHINGQIATKLNNNNTLIYIAPACRMTSEALADSSSRATEFLTEK